MLELPWSPGYVTSLFLFAPTQNSQDLEKSACGRDAKTNEGRGGHRVIDRYLCSVSSPVLIVYVQH